MVAHFSAREFLTDIYRGAIAALHPAHAVRNALDAVVRDAVASESDRDSGVVLIAVGKAATAMMQAARSWCDERGVALAGGLCVAHVPAPIDDARITSAVGDHPQPGDRSERAAAQLASFVEANVTPQSRVFVLLSGGASALIGAPCEGIAARDYRDLTSALLDSGLDINAMNAVRRRISRWGGGRLGDALQSRGARSVVLAISDVIGDDLAAIGSGPCIPHSAGDISAAAALERAEIPDALRRRWLQLLAERSHRSALVDAEPIPHHIISSNRVVADAIVRLVHTRESDPDVRREDTPLRGDAHDWGAMIAQRLLGERATMRHSDPPVSSRVICWGGEPTVVVPGPDAPAGGRMQALALRAAQVLHDAGANARGITILAAGTDGRDGATDAAGAVVDCETWNTILASGRDPARDLAQFRSHDSLRAAHGLIPSFASGTNVNDVVIAMIEASDR